MTTATERTTAGRFADKAALAVICSAMAAAVAAGYAAKRLLTALEARDARRERREGERRD